MKQEVGVSAEWFLYVIPSCLLLFSSTAPQFLLLLFCSMGSSMGCKEYPHFGMGHLWAAVPL